MSQALFDRAAQERHRALSAGTTPAEHLHPEVVQVMNELGIDVSGRIPTALIRELAEQADLVITMGCGDECPPAIGTSTGISRTPPVSRSVQYERSATKSTPACGSSSGNWIEAEALQHPHELATLAR